MEARLPARRRARQPARRRARSSGASGASGPIVRPDLAGRRLSEIALLGFHRGCMVVGVHGGNNNDDVLL